MADVADQARRLFTEVLVAKEPRALEELLADDYLGEDAFEGKQDRDDLLEAFAAYHRAFPDLSYEVEDVMGAGDRATVRWTLRGTNTGPLRDTGKTGRSVRVHGISICEFRPDGKLSGIWSGWDTLRFFEQLGLVAHLPATAPRHAEHHGGASTRSSVHHRG